jgi:hypothetical protein
MKDANAGFVPTFLKQMEGIMGECLEKGIRVVVNAGGLNPRGLASALTGMASSFGLKPTIACIEGDDLMPRLGELQEAGEEFVHLDKGIPLRSSKAMTISANAYLGCWGIVKALEEGADIVVGGRIADASLVVGPAAWRFGWSRDDLDRLAGATVAGHIIECGARAATTPSSTRCRASSGWASPSPRCTGTGRRSSPSTRARAAWCRWTR